MFPLHTAPEHADVVARAVVGARRSDGRRVPVQPRLLYTLFDRLPGRGLDFDSPPRVSSGVPPSSEPVPALDPDGARGRQAE